MVCNESSFSEDALGKIVSLLCDPYGLFKCSFIPQSQLLEQNLNFNSLVKNYLDVILTVQVLGCQAFATIDVSDSLLMFAQV